PRRGRSPLRWPRRLQNQAAQRPLSPWIRVYARHPAGLRAAARRMLAPMSSLPRIVPPLICAVTAIAVGCGGGPQAVSSPELVQRADEICGSERGDFAGIQDQPAANAGEAADQTQQLIDVANTELSDLRDLEPPDPQRAAYNAYLEARQRAVDLLQRGKDAADNPDGDAY